MLILGNAAILTRLMAKYSSHQSTASWYFENHTEGGKGLRINTRMASLVDFCNKLNETLTVYTELHM